MAILVATPSLLLPGRAANAAEIVTLVAILVSLLSFVEYYTEYPSFVEFRDAPPVNRMRFAALFLMILVLSIISKHKIEPTNLTAMLFGIGSLIGQGLDFPYSPVRLVILMLPDTASAMTIDAVRIAAGVTYMIALITVVMFVFVVRVLGWPTSRGAFNVWINLPLFDPTAGGDVVFRLRRESQINICLGVLLPFAIPAVVKFAANLIDPITMNNPHTMIWAISAWAFLPANMAMRGIAMMRIADLIEEKRRRTYANAEAIPTA